MVASPLFFREGKWKIRTELLGKTYKTPDHYQNKL
ncbi:hypothetical protein J2S13_001012 [Oikeobacillus pervagus]|uniref:Uncharacterized protein n=1 Tax=Oikeobacillus pervagus TaxID=1325931 RepID=A0AAJ1T0R2_9BACI|nr:hypothetical protein [Oikeobacillus pervagus]